MSQDDQKPDEAEQIRSVMKLIGSRKTARKAVTSAANAAKGAEATRKTEADIACTCGRDAPALEHAWTCPRKRWAHTRKRREDKRKPQE